MTGKSQQRYKTSYQKTSRRQRRSKTRFGLPAAAVASVIAGIGYMVVFSPFFQIERIQIHGLDVLPRLQVERHIENYIDTKVAGFDSKSIFLVRPRALSNSLLAEFARIGHVRVQRTFPATLIISLQERKAIGLWCQAHRSCFLLDKTGVIFEPVLRSTDYGVVVEASEQEARIGTAVLDELLLAGIRQAYDLLSEEEELEIETFAIEQEDNRITLGTKAQWNVHFTTSRPLANQALNVSLVLKEKIPPGLRDNLDYIDARFGNRIFYKYR